MRNRTQRRQEERNNKKIKVGIVVNPNLPKRSEELIEELSAATMSLFRTFNNIREKLDLNFEEADLFFGAVVQAHNTFMMNPTTTAADYKLYESSLLKATNK